MKKWKISESLFDDIINKYSPLSSGATESRKDFFPNEFTQIGINKRNLENNDFYGTVITLPFSNKLVFGLSYFDKKEKKDNEDIVVLNKISKEIEVYMRGSYERINKLYKGTHKGNKDYLK